MADNVLVSRVYDLKIAGYDDAQKKVDALTLAFSKMDETKKKLNTSLQEKLQTGDSEAIAALNKQIADLNQQMTILSQKKNTAAQEAALLAKAEQATANAKLAEAKATTEQVKADTIRTKSIIDQEKELDRQIALEQKQTAQAEKAAQPSKAAPGNYYDLLAQSKAATEQYRVTVPSDPLFESVKQSAIEAQAAVYNFTRSLSADGTLVGEYKSGIVNAFKELGLGDILLKQKDDISNQLNQLKEEAQNLASTYKEASQSSASSLAKINEQIQLNIIEQEKLKQQAAQLAEANQLSAKESTAAMQQVNTRLEELKIQGQELSDQYLVTSENGSQAFIKIDEQLRENINTQQQLGKSLNTIEEQFPSLGQKAREATESIRDGFKDVGKEVGLTLISFFGIQQGLFAIDNLFDKSTEEFEKQETNALRLQNAIKNIGGTSEDLEKLKKDAEGLAGKFTFLNENDITKAQEKLVTYGKLTQDQIRQLLPTIIEFSNNAGLSLEEGTSTILKALEGNSRGLKEYGINIKEGGDTAERFGIIQDELAKKVSNTAETFGATNTGKLATWKEQIVKIQESIGKQLVPALAGATDSLLPFLKALGSCVVFIIQNIGLIATLAGLYGAYSLALVLGKNDLIAYVAEQALYIAATGIEKAQLIANTIVMSVYTAATNTLSIAKRVLAGETTLAAGAMEFFNTVVKANPLGFFLTVVLALGAAFVVLSSKAYAAVDATSQLAIKQRLLSEVQSRANAAISEQIGTINSWMVVIQSSTASVDTKRQALEKLIEIDSRFKEALNGDIIDLGKLKIAYDEVTKSITDTANAEASRALTSEKQKNLVKIEQARITLETAYAQQKNNPTQFGIQTTDVKDDDVKNILKNLPTADFTRSLFHPTEGLLTIQKVDYQKSLDFLKKQEVDAANQYITADKIAQEFEDKIKPKDSGVVAKPLSVFERFQKLLKGGGTESDFEDLIKDIQGQKSKLNLLSKEYKDLDALQQKVQELLNPTKKTNEGSKLSGTQKDALKDIETNLEIQKAQLEKAFLTGSSFTGPDQKPTLITSEQTYLTEMLALNEEAIAKKIQYLTKGKNDVSKLTIEERKLVADLNLEKVKDEQETSKKIFDIKEKELSYSLDNAKKQAQTNLDKVKDDPYATNLAKLQAQEKFYQAELAAETLFTSQLLALEKQYGQKSSDAAQKAKDAIIDITNSIAKIKLQIPEAILQDALDKIDKEANAALDKIGIDSAKKVNAILSNKNLSDGSKANAISDIQNDATKDVDQVNVDKLQKEVSAYAIEQGLFANNKEALLIIQEKYNAKVKELEDAKNKLLEDSKDKQINIFTAVQNGWKNLTAALKGTKISQADIDGAINAGIQHVENAITDAYKAYFDGQKQKVEAERQFTDDRLNLQEQQVESTATSEAQKQSIERQYAEKKKDADKVAADQKKKIALQQMSIDFGVAVVKTLAEYPFPFSLIPVAGLTIEYLLQRSAAEAQQFKFGGWLKKKLGGMLTSFGKGGWLQNFATGGHIKKAAWGSILGNGGEFEGNSHADGGNKFLFGKTPIESEAKEAYIINKNSTQSNDQFTVTGTPKQIASSINQVGGGVPFSPGGSIHKLEYGGGLGSNLHAPVNPQSFLSTSSQNNNNDLKDLIAQQSENIDEMGRQIHKRIDKLQVYVVADEVQKKNNDKKKASARATI